LTNATNCILASRCKLAGTADCHAKCPAFIALHGMSGASGRVAAANLPADYRLVTLANSPARESQPDVYRMVDAYASTFDRQFVPDAPRIKSLYLWSESPGTGKTTTAAALVNEWLAQHYIGSLKRGRQALQRPAYFLDVNEWQELYNGFNRKGVPQEIAEQKSRLYYTQMENAMRAQFVVLDDVGVRSATEGFRGDLHAIINHRVASGLPTIYTSNLPLNSGVAEKDKIEAYKPYDIIDVFGERLYDRMRDMCVELKFDGKSRRGKR
jgi:DNA replication protein DnaC